MIGGKKVRDLSAAWNLLRDSLTQPMAAPQKRVRPRWQAPDSACVCRLCGFAQSGLDQAPRGIGNFDWPVPVTANVSTLGFAVSVAVWLARRDPHAQVTPGFTNSPHGWWRSNPRATGFCSSASI